MTTLSALDVFALTLYGESRNQPVEGKIAVANVIRNRLLTHRWGTSYEAVCLARLQFSCWTPIGGATNYRTLKTLKDQIIEGTLAPDKVLRECYTIARVIMADELQDSVAHATHYYVSGTPEPHWAQGHEPVCTIGSHRFYSGIK